MIDQSARLLPDQAARLCHEKQHVVHHALYQQPETLPIRFHFGGMITLSGHVLNQKGKVGPEAGGARRRGMETLTLGTLGGSLPAATIICLLYTD